MRKVTPKSSAAAPIDHLLARASLGEPEAIRHLNTLCHQSLQRKAGVLTSLGFQPDPRNAVERRIASRLRGLSAEERRDAADIAVANVLVYMAAPCRRTAREAREAGAVAPERRTNWMLVRPGKSPVHFLGGVLKHKLAEALVDELASEQDLSLESAGHVAGSDGEGVWLQFAASRPDPERQLMAARALEALPAAIRAMPPALRQASEELVAEHTGATQRTRPLSNAEMVARTRARQFLAKLLGIHLEELPNLLGLPGVVPA